MGLNAWSTTLNAITMLLLLFISRLICWTQKFSVVLVKEHPFKRMPDQPLVMHIAAVKIFRELLTTV